MAAAKDGAKTKWKELLRQGAPLLPETPEYKALAAASGTGFVELCQWVVELAVEHPPLAATG